MRTIVHRTPGLIDVRSFTLMGASAKPNSTNPIGQFGTGMKYSIAVLVRMGVKPAVYIGRDKYTFYCEKADFRGAEFDQIRMKKERWSLTRASKHDLPYTTSYGKNWQAWMVFRELHSNTLDEGGSTFEVDTVEGNAALITGEGDSIGFAKDDHTTIVIESDEYAAAFDTHNDIFLVGAEPGGKAGVQVLPVGAEPNRIYYRGVRALDTAKPTLFVYNINEQVPLTEDRTLPEWYAREFVARAIVVSDDEEFVESVVSAGEDNWEHGLEFPTWATPSEAFKRVMRRVNRPSHGAFVYWSKHDDTPKAATFDLFKAHPRPWKVVGTSVFDARDKRIMQEPHGYVGQWGAFGAAVVAQINGSTEPSDLASANWDLFAQVMRGEVAPQLAEIVSNPEQDIPF